MLGLQAGDPEQIGPYLLLGRLGQGGIGLVFLGQSADGRPAAVKVIRPDLAADSELRARFRREVTAAQQVSGPFTAEVIGADAAGPQPWLALAYVAGPSLAEIVAEYGPLPVSSLTALAAGLAAGLCATQAAGLAHGALKPANVLLAPDGPRITDFGYSPEFVYPEQAEDGEPGPSGDVFRLGLVLAFAATGDPSFSTSALPVPGSRLAHGSPDLDRVPAELRSLVERCLAEDPGKRPAPADILAETGPARPGPGWLPSSITGGTAGFRPAPPQLTRPRALPTAPQVAAQVSATRPELLVTPASVRPGAGASQAAVASAKPFASRALRTASAVAAAVAVAGALIVVILVGHSGHPQAASRPAHPAPAHRPAAVPAHLAAWSAGQRVDRARAFASLSCPAAGFCLAVDSGGNVYAYAGGRWSGPRHLASGPLTSISCATVGFCAAIGPHGLGFVYTDGTWSAPSELAGADGNPADLRSVSCPVTGRCLAAGKWDAYTYSAGRWATGQQVQQVQQSYTFASLSCPAAGSCLAVDSGGNVYASTGGRWSGPRHLASGPLTSISCATVGFCAATGANGTGYVYTDGRWSAPSQLTDADGAPADLKSVSCPVTGRCLAAGKSDVYTYSAGRWARGHQIQKVSTFTSISCPGTTFCMAADAEGNMYTYSAS
ncbi:MAG: protein kinase [Streptosporangiaceae bacterium]